MVGMRPEPGGPAAGTRVARYWLEEQIGRGGMAVVFRARDERLARQVALKVLSPALAADEDRPTWDAFLWPPVAATPATAPPQCHPVP